jgi:hypothetical protein
MENVLFIKKLLSNEFLSFSSLYSCFLASKCGNRTDSFFSHCHPLATSPPLLHSSLSLFSRSTQNIQRSFSCTCYTHREKGKCERARERKRGKVRENERKFIFLFNILNNKVSLVSSAEEERSAEEKLPEIYSH